MGGRAGFSGPKVRCTSAHQSADFGSTDEFAKLGDSYLAILATFCSCDARNFAAPRLSLLPSGVLGGVSPRNGARNSGFGRASEGRGVEADLPGNWPISTRRPSPRFPLKIGTARNSYFGVQLCGAAFSCVAVVRFVGVRPKFGGAGSRGCGIRGRRLARPVRGFSYRLTGPNFGGQQLGNPVFLSREPTPHVPMSPPTISR